MLSKVYAENFQSWEDLEYPIEPGVSNIDGFNEDDQTPEGSGKSAVLNVICWTGYGKLPKDTNIDDVIKYGKKTCKGVLEFENGDLIVRTRKPNDLYIQKADGTRIKGKDINETQTLITEYIGLDFETFCQSVYFAQNYPNRFLSSNNEAKGKILSSIQNLVIFDKASKEASTKAKLEETKLKEHQHSLALLDNSLTGIAGKISMVQNFISEKKKIHETQVATLNIKIRTNKDQVSKAEQDFQLACQAIEQHLQVEGPVSIEELDNAKNELRNTLAQLDAQRRQVDTVNATINSKNQEVNRLGIRYSTLEVKKQKLTDFINNPSSSCPTCGTELTECDTSHAQKDLKDLEDEILQIAETLQGLSDFLQNNEPVTLTEISQKVTTINNEIRTLDGSRQAIKVRQDEFNGLLRTKDVKESVIQSTQKQGDSLETELRMLKPVDTKKDESDLKALELQLVEDQERRDSIFQLHQACNIHYSKMVDLKEAFKEIKTYIFVNTLNELNYRTNQYLSKLFEVSATIKFSTEDQKIETSICLDGETTSLGLLSGGQNRRYDLAVNLAISDIVNNRKMSKLNFLMLDEYFKDLSEVTMEKCLNLLKVRKSPVILIEHNSLFKSIVDKTFLVKLKNKTSTVA